MTHLGREEFDSMAVEVRHHGLPTAVQIPRLNHYRPTVLNPKGHKLIDRVHLKAETRAGGGWLARGPLGRFRARGQTTDT
jgi:hypothetical protein